MLSFSEISYVKTSITVLKKGEFTCVLKHADVIPVHKKEIKSDKINYRPVSILPSLSKTYEKLMYQQLYEHFKSILSQNQCGFRKGYSTQHCLMVMLKKFKESRNKRDEFGLFSLTFLTNPIA